MTHLTPTEAAIVAAAQASEATTELLRYVREGEVSVSTSFNDDVVGKLAEALNLAIDIEGRDPDTLIDDEQGISLAELKSSLARFIEGWAG